MQLVDRIKEFESVAPTLVARLSSDNPSLALKALAEAFDADNPQPDADAIVEKVDAASVSSLLGVIGVAEGLLSRVVSPIADIVTEATAPPRSAIDALFPDSLTGLKTAIGVAIYVAAAIAETVGVGSPMIIDVVQYVATAIAGAGMIGKVDRFILALKGR